MACTKSDEAQLKSRFGSFLQPNNVRTSKSCAETSQAKPTGMVHAESSCAMAPVHESTQSKTVSSASLVDAPPVAEELHSLTPGLKVPFDNFDLYQVVRDMTEENQNRDLHWVNHNIVSGNHLPSEGETWTMQS